MMKAEELKLTEEWDKVFPKSEKVEHRKVTFINHFGITLAADMYTPKNAEGKLAAVAVSGPFGAVKEQSSGLYAQEMAERGFLAIAFDPSFTGESGGFPRDMHSPDIDVEDFQAAVDFLSVQENVDPEKIGIIGICGWGGMALQTACIDTRIKATVTSTMYDMSRVAGNGYFGKKKESYAKSHISVTRRMSESSIHEWSLDDITERDVIVSEQLKTILEKWNADYQRADPPQESQEGPTPEQLEMIRRFRENSWV